MAAPTNNNTLTNLIPDIYAALDQVARELVGFIPSVTRDPGVDRVAVGQNVRIQQTAANTAGRDTTPAMAFSTASNQTVGNAALTLSKSRNFPFSWSWEDRYAVNMGPGSLSINQQQIAQAMRAAVNEIETDIAVAAALGGCRAATANDTTLFKSTLADAAYPAKILDDNGAPASERTLIISTAAMAAMRTLTHLTDVQASGSDTFLRQGIVGDLFGMNIRQSAQIQNPAVGTTTNAVLASTATTVGQPMM